MARNPIALARRAAIFVLLLAALLAPGISAAASQATPAADSAGSVELSGLLEQAGPLTLDDLAAYESETVDVTYLSGDGEQAHTYTGARLWTVLDDHGIQLPEGKNGQLNLVVRITASDGYSTVLALGDLDPNFGHAQILLAWEEDGEALAAPRLIVPGDVHGGRYVSDVVTIEVLGLPAA